MPERKALTVRLSDQESRDVKTMLRPFLSKLILSVVVFLVRRQRRLVSEELKIIQIVFGIQETAQLAVHWWASFRSPHFDADHVVLSARVTCLSRHALCNTRLLLLDNQASPREGLLATINMTTGRSSLLESHQQWETLAADVLPRVV
jgi:hypothetical protein